MSSVFIGQVATEVLEKAASKRRMPAVSFVMRCATQLAVLARANASLLRQLWCVFPVMTVIRLSAGFAMVACTFANWWGSGMVIQGLADSQALMSLSLPLCALFFSVVLLGMLPTLLSGLDKIGENWVFRHVQSEIAAKAATLDQTTLNDPDFAARFKQVKDRAVWRMMAMMKSQPLIIRSVGMVVVSIVMLGLYDIGLALIVLVAFIPCMGVEARHAQRQSKVDEELAPLWGSLWGDLWNLTTTSSISMLQVLGAAGWFSTRYQNGVERAASRENKLERSAIAVRLLVALIGGIVLVGVSLALMSRVAAGELTLSKLVLMLGAVSSLGLSLADSASLLGQQFSQAYYVNALNKLLETKSKIQFPKSGVEVQEQVVGGAALLFDSVSYRYPGKGQSKLALDKVSLMVCAGQKVAMVGPNGAGKSTAMSLMTRQVDPTDGCVQVDAKSLSEMDEITLRKLVILLPQSLRHYNLTLGELLNIGRSTDPANEAEIATALKRTGSDKFAEKWPGGLGTQFGSDRVNGVEPSGGQLQRLLLTAVLLASSRLIILDEPVSMVDPEAAKQFWDAVFTEMPDKTVIFSTHHLGAVRRADLILFIDDGKLVASGHHDELITKCARYRELFESQANDYR